MPLLYASVFYCKLKGAMGRRKLRLKVEKNKEKRRAELITRPKGRPPKKGPKNYSDYKQRVCSNKFFSS